QGDEHGRGCYASNNWLGERLRKNGMYISGRISQLQKSGMLMIVNYEGRRYLEVDWSRTAEERAAMDDEYGELLRKEFTLLEAIVEEGTGKPVGGVQENLTKVGTGKPVPINNDKTNDS